MKLTPTAFPSFQASHKQTPTIRSQLVPVHHFFRQVNEPPETRNMRLSYNLAIKLIIAKSLHTL